MKTNDEMVKSLLTRRDAYFDSRKKKRKTAARLGVCGASLCIVAALCLGLFNNTPNPAAKTDPSSSAVQTSSDSAHNDAYKDKIVINNIDAVPGGRKMNIALIWDDFTELSKAELIDYYGTNIFPTVPADLKDENDPPFGIYKRDGGKGETYYDTTILNYSNSDFSRSVNIEIDKGGLPSSCYAIFGDLSETSVINGTEVSVGKTGDGYYYAQFTCRGTGFRVICNGLSEEETVSVIASLV